MTRPRVAIVGAGVVGLSCAATLKKFCDVTVFADRVGIETDSLKATAVWHVYLVPETEEVLEWSAVTLRTLYQLAMEHPDAGLELVEGIELFRTTPFRKPSWADIPRRFEMLGDDVVANLNSQMPPWLSERERAALAAAPVTWGYRIVTACADMAVYLPWLTHRVKSDPSVTIQKRAVSSLPKIGKGFDFVVNCTGLGARELCGDEELSHSKGQYFVLRRNGGPTSYIGDDEHPLGMAYMIPRASEILVGGISEFGVDDLGLTLDFEATLRRAALFVPEMLEMTEEDQVRSPVVGLRPWRKSGVRVELDLKSGPVPVVHNYGHGGSGFSLSWGCAEAVGCIIRSLSERGPPADWRESSNEQ